MGGRDIAHVGSHIWRSDIRRSHLGHEYCLRWSSGRVEQFFSVAGHLVFRRLFLALYFGVLEFAQRRYHVVLALVQLFWRFCRYGVGWGLPHHFLSVG